MTNLMYYSSQFFGACLGVNIQPSPNLKVHVRDLYCDLFAWRIWGIADSWIQDSWH